MPRPDRAARACWYRPGEGVTHRKLLNVDRKQLGPRERASSPASPSPPSLCALTAGLLASFLSTHARRRRSPFPFPSSASPTSTVMTATVLTRAPPSPLPRALPSPPPSAAASDNEGCNLPFPISFPRFSILPLVMPPIPSLPPYSSLPPQTSSLIHDVAAMGRLLSRLAPPASFAPAASPCPGPLRCLVSATGPTSFCTARRTGPDADEKGESAEEGGE